MSNKKYVSTFIVTKGSACTRPATLNQFEAHKVTVPCPLSLSPLYDSYGKTVLSIVEMSDSCEGRRQERCAPSADDGATITNWRHSKVYTFILQIKRLLY